MTRAEVEHEIAAGLRSAIAAHGPITLERLGSAAKRVYGQLAGASALHIEQGDT